MAHTINPVDAPKADIGESPWWDVETQTLYWIDMLGKKVHSLKSATGISQSWEVPTMITGMVIGKHGTAIISLVDGIYTLDLNTGTCDLLATSPDLDDTVQLADAKSDRRGRFIVGSSHRGMKDNVGKLYVLDPGESVLRQIDDDYILGNGPCWSPDDKTFYHADSVRNMIYAYDYDLDSGTASNRREFASTSEWGGIPDGATVDAEGFVWSAICEGGVVVRFNPDGRTDRVIDMPVKCPASVIFGGPNLDQLFVPSLSPAFLGREADPLDGTLFIIDGLESQGLPETRFQG